MPLTLSAFSSQLTIQTSARVLLARILRGKSWNQPGHAFSSHSEFQSAQTLLRNTPFSRTISIMAARSTRKRKAPEAVDQPQKKSRQSKRQTKTEEEELDTEVDSASIPSIKDEIVDSVVKDEETANELKHIPSHSETNGYDEDVGSRRRSLRSRRTAAKPSYAEEESADEKKPSRASTKKPPAKKTAVKKEIKEEDEEVKEKKPQKTPKKTKANPYGLTPGITPFPEWEAPSAEDCEDVYRRLAKLHGESKAPEKIPAPSLEVSGCGEVPSVIDALVRTRLSANTSNSNSSAAFRGLVDKFGILKEGIGKGSVDWDKVRQAPLTDIVQAIKCGGLAQIKGRDIKNILEMVYEENKARREAFLAEKESGAASSIPGSSEKTQGQKDLEIRKSEENLISLDHMHGMDPEQAMLELTKFPGIGVKTASCVILFCLRQPSFAVDTHVHRISGWLGWIPPPATRDQAFSHLEVRVPNELKYGLHKLFVQHGRSCLRCRANTSAGTEGWEGVECPIEGVVDRGGGKKKGKGGKGGKGKKVNMDEDYE